MPAAEYEAAVLADTPRVFWTMQQSSGLLVDSSGNGLDMTSVNGAPDYDQAGPFTGADAIFFEFGESFRRSSVVSTVTDNFTMEFWLKVTSMTTGTRTLFENDNGGGGTGWGARISAVSHKIMGLANGTEQAHSQYAFPFDDATWGYVVVIRRSGTWEYWINGVLDTGNAGSGAPSTPSGEVQLHAGNGLSSDMTYMAVYETALSGAQIQEHYAQREYGPEIAWTTA